MLKQFSYSLRDGLAPRLAVAVLMLALNLVFTALSAAGIAGFGARVTGISLCGTALGAYFILMIISASKGIDHMFKAPRGYAILLTPVPAWKLLLSRVLTIVLPDSVLLAIGITGVTWQSLLLAGFTMTNVVGTTAMNFNTIFWGAVAGIAYYTLLISMIFFANALSGSIFYRFRARTALGVLSSILTTYALSLSHFILLPFASYDRYGLFFNVYIGLSFNALTVFALLLVLTQAALLLAASAQLIDRGFNI